MTQLDSLNFSQNIHHTVKKIHQRFQELTQSRFTLKKWSKTGTMQNCKSRYVIKESHHRYGLHLWRIEICDGDAAYLWHCLTEAPLKLLSKFFYYLKFWCILILFFFFCFSFPDVLQSSSFLKEPQMILIPWVYKFYLPLQMAYLMKASFLWKYQKESIKSNEKVFDLSKF